MTQPNETIFSKILRREIPATVVYETESVLAFRDVNPGAPTHILVIPKKPIVDISTAGPEDAQILGELMLAAAEVARREGIEKTGYRVVTNIGPHASQSVLHLHLHVIGGRQLGWPPG